MHGEEEASDLKCFQFCRYQRHNYHHHTIGQQDDDRLAWREGSRCGTASPWESLISFTSLIDSRPSSGDYTSKGKGQGRGKRGGLKRNGEEEGKNICTGISKY